MVGLTEKKHNIPGYTGFVPGGQHQIARTYGQATQEALAERQANGDPKKWRKFVSYAELTPARTPCEEHHMPGYSGHVPGVYSENLFAKTYGKTTLQAVRGTHAKGCELGPEEQFRSSTEVLMGETAGHPGKPQDIMPGGPSWTGASPYNFVEPSSQELAPASSQSAGSKDPRQSSPLLKNFGNKMQTIEPALIVTSKANPHSTKMRNMQQKSITEGNYRVPGYSGFVPGVQSENLFANTFATITAKADTIKDRKSQGPAKLDTSGIGQDGVLTLTPASAPRPRTSEMATTRVDGPTPHEKHVPGYTGFVPGVQSENIFGTTYGHSSQIAIAGDHKRFQWREQEPSERFLTSSQSSLKDFGHPANIEDGHLTVAHTTTSPARVHRHVGDSGLSSHALPGYGGFLPGVAAGNMFGKTHFETTAAALQKFEAQKSGRATTAPPKVESNQQPDVGMLQFKPSGIVYQKRMQGDWNNGMLGSRNYSAVKLAEGNHWKGDPYQSTAREAHKGHTPADVPLQYSKGPQPTFLNMDHALKHKSVYLGFNAL